jgi:hypothetical protein
VNFDFELTKFLTININTLLKRCKDVYCTYKFFNAPLHTSAKAPHDLNLYFNDVNVVLAGLLDKPLLREHLHTPLRIEVHDRDRSKIIHEPPKPCLFGKDAKLDEGISSVSLSAATHTQHNPFDAKDAHWDPFGVATAPLDELILGQRMIELCVPVLPCAAPDVFARGGGNSKRDDQPMQPGDYLNANTQLNITVWSAKAVFSSGGKNGQSTTAGEESSRSFPINTHRLLSSQKRKLNISADDEVRKVSINSKYEI